MNKTCGRKDNPVKTDSKKRNKNRLSENRGNMAFFYLNLHLYDNYLVENTI